MTDLYWLSHMDDSCVGIWLISSRIRGYYCSHCGAFIYRTRLAQQAYGEWVTVDKSLRRLIAEWKSQT